MILQSSRRSSLLAAAALAVAAASVLSACRQKEPPAAPLATPSVRLNHEKVPLGAPIEITYTFVVAADARFEEDFRVMAHVVDADDELMWTDDHDPPTPTRQWKPGQTVEYTRTIFVPIYPYIGEATIRLGLYSTENQRRQPLTGEDTGQRAYTVARLQLQPQTENVFTVFKDGWHPAEVAEHNATVEWYWTRKDATLAFRNPGKDCVFYLDLDNPGSVFHDPQQVKVSVGGQTVDEFTLKEKQPQLRKIALKADQFGTGEMVELQISVDTTYVPALVSGSGSKDPRELGVRVFHAFVDPR
jgi:hypothetical protein